MATIYVSLSSHIAKVLRKELSNDGAPIDLPSFLRSDNYWKSRNPHITAHELRHKPTLRDMFIAALYTGTEPIFFRPHLLTYSENEYNQFPDSDEKKNELVAFLLPKTLSDGRVTNANTRMERVLGQNFRQAIIYFAYDYLARYLHGVEQECLQEKRPFRITEAIRMFAEKYDMTSDEHHTLYTKYYRRKIK